MTSAHRLAVLAAVLTGASLMVAMASVVRARGYEPGERVLLDAHNAYPERGRWADRIERALATGTPVAIEQDLHWAKPPGATSYTSVVAHDVEYVNDAPTLNTHFFERIRPIMEQALRENHRETWPLIVLNLDFKDNQSAHLDYIWSLLGQYEGWLTTAMRSATPHRVEPFTVGPLLVLSGSDTAQRRRFHDDVPVGARLRAFGAVVPAAVAGRTTGQRARRSIRMSAAQHLAQPADNFARWVNFPWRVVEQGGQHNARDWTATDSVRLASLVQRAHDQHLWIRFYTLDGFAPAQDRGFSADYNFGTGAAVRARWQAAIAVGVDFVATDQYEEFSAMRSASLRVR